MEQSGLESLNACPVCRSNELVLDDTVMDHSISKKAFTLMRCGACGFLFTNPRPDQLTIGTFYQGEAYISHASHARGLRDHLYHLARRWTVRAKFNRMRDYRAQGRLLDIGCGTGEFLAYAGSRGYMPVGVEPDQKTRELVQAKYNFPVHPRLELVHGGEPFQAVTMWHVLEHVPDIRDTLKRVHALLSDRGLLMIAVPDRESWDAQHYGQDWAALDVPRHFWHFRRRDLQRLLHEHGFELLQTERIWMDALYIAMLSEQYRGASMVRSMVVGGLVGLYSNMIALATGRPTSSSLYIAQKQKA